MNIEKMIKEYPIKKLNVPQRVVLYGASVTCRQVLKLLEQYGIQPLAICDSSVEKIGNLFEGYIISSLEEVLKKYSDFKFLITVVTPPYSLEIEKYLLEYVDKSMISRFLINAYNNYKDFLIEHKKEMYKAYEILEDDLSRKTFEGVIKAKLYCDSSYLKDIYDENHTYMLKGITELKPLEVIIDGGAYKGDTLLDFTQKASNKYKKIYCFEPSKDSFKILVDVRERLDEKENVIVLNKGIGDKNETLNFYKSSAGAAGNSFYKKASVLETDVESIECVTIDSALDDEVTFIKMDIEGYELKALKGAEKTIIKNKPKLAICVYHLHEDIFEIPLYLNSLELGYNFYMRSHVINRSTGTVLYAVIKERDNK